MIIGIDLGTTNSLAATVFAEEGPEVICQAGENPITPSVLFNQEGRWVVGEEAFALGKEHPERMITSVKRLMGRDLSEIQDLSHYPYQIVEAQRKLVKVRVGDKEYTPQELSAEILKAVKQRAESVLGKTIDKAVITVPAYFDDAQRQATRDAGKMAGLEVMRILNEPTAAAIAYGLEERKNGKVAIYDLGGGTFDISILDLKDKLFKVIATHGNSHLGGDDFDHTLRQHLIQAIQSTHPGVELQTPAIQQYLKQQAEALKIELSQSPEAQYTLALPGTDIILENTMTREQFDALIHDWVELTFESCQKALDAAGATVADIDEVVLVGGSTRVPYVRKQVATFFKKDPHLSIDPYKVVAIGAGIQGHLLAGGRRDFLLLDVVPLSLGIETLGGAFQKLIMGNTTIPAEAKELFTTHVDHQTSIDVNIYQGERELVKDCRCLGHFKLRGFPPMPAGFPLVEVTFRVDANGILAVSALEKRSGTKAEIDVVPLHGLTQQEITQIMEDSFEHAIEDFNDRQLVDFRNTVDAVMKGIEANWTQAESLFPQEELTRLQEQMAIVREYAAKTDAMALKEQMDILGEMTRPLADAAISDTVLHSLQSN